MKAIYFRTLSVFPLVDGMVGTFARAAPLAQGDTIFVTGTTVASNPELGDGVQQYAILTTNTRQVLPDANPLTNFADFEIQNRVVRSDMDATMIFAPRIILRRNVTPYSLLVNRVEMWGFGDFGIDASYRTDGLGDRGPTTGSRSGDGQTLSFEFDFPLVVNNSFMGPQEENYFFSLKTDATAFENTGRLSLFAEAVGDPVPGREYRFDVGGLAVPADMAAVSLPVSLSLLTIGAFGLTLLRRNRLGGLTRTGEAGEIFLRHHEATSGGFAPGIRRSDGPHRRERCAGSTGHH